MFNKKKINKHNPKKDSVNYPHQMHNELNISSIAIVLDGEIQDIIRTEPRLAALLLSEPKFIDVTELEIKPYIGWAYDEDLGEFKQND